MMMEGRWEGMGEEERDSDDGREGLGEAGARGMLQKDFEWDKIEDGGWSVYKRADADEGRPG